MLYKKVNNIVCLRITRLIAAIAVTGKRKATERKYIKRMVPLHIFSPF